MRSWVVVAALALATVGCDRGPIKRVASVTAPEAHWGARSHMWSNVTTTLVAEDGSKCQVPGDSDPYAKLVGKMVQCEWVVAEALAK